MDGQEDMSRKTEGRNANILGRCEAGGGTSDFQERETRTAAVRKGKRAWKREIMHRKRIVMALLPVISLLLLWLAVNVGEADRLEKYILDGQIGRAHV